MIIQKINYNINLIHEENSDKFFKFTKKTRNADIITSQPLVKIKLDISDIIEKSLSITYKGNIYNIKYKCQYYRHNEI